MNLATLLGQLEPELLTILEKEGVQKTFKQGDVIIKTGQYIRSTVIVLEGTVKIYRQDEEGSEFLIYYIGPGEACAVSIICALQAQTSEIMAQAEEDTTVLMIPVQLMEELMMQYKSWSRFVIQTYKKRFEELLNVIDQVAFRNMDERLEFYLKRHVEINGKTGIELSHQQIADDLNTSREVISRLLKKMEQRNFLRLQRNRIEIIKS